MPRNRSRSIDRRRGTRADLRDRARSRIRRRNLRRYGVITSNRSTIGNNNYTGLIGKSLGFPRNQKVLLRFVDVVINGVETNGALTQTSFVANGPYDPRPAAGTDQAFGFDQWATLYNHYTVIGSKIAVSCRPIVNAAMPVSFGVYLADDTTAYTDWCTLKETGRGMMGFQGAGLASAGRSIVAKYSQKRFFAGNLNQSTQGAQVTANPTDVAIYYLWCQPIDKATTVAVTSYSFTVVIDYIILFGEPKDVPASAV